MANIKPITSPARREALNENFNALNSDIATKDSAINQRLNDHENSTAAHDGKNITYQGKVAGQNVNEAIEQLNDKDTAINNRIDTLITNQDLNPNKDAELLDLRNSELYGIFSTADQRLESIEKRSKYFNREVKTVALGSNTITLNVMPENNHQLLIFDTTYGCVWESGTHWNRNGKTITFTEPSFPETISFVIYNLG